jgi:uncharacterized membrane protein
MISEMALPIPPITPAWLIDLEYMAGWKAALIFAALAVPIVLLGMRSLAGLGPVRKWVAIALRLLVLLVLVLIIAGARWQRLHKTMEVMVLRDHSESIELFRQYPGKNLKESIEDYLRLASDDKHKTNQDDRIGIISFSDKALVDAMPSTGLDFSSRAIREQGNATDIASAIQLALATSSRDAMRRFLLITDGNQTAGDLDSALAGAVSQGVKIDVMPLRYAVNNEILVERLSAPSWKHESEAFEIFVSLISTNPLPVRGKLTIFEEGIPFEKRDITIDAANLTNDGRIEPRKHMERVRVPAAKMTTVRRFTAQFDPEVVNSRTAAANAKPQAGDTLLQNNTASAFTLVKGQGRVLYVDGTKDGGGKTLMDALQLEGIEVLRVNIDQVPEDLVALQNYDLVILNNVPRGRTPLGNDGLTEKHDAALASYVHDFGGGLIMIGGEDSLGAGGWQGSKIEEIMPVNFDIPAQRQMPKGALVLIVHSCEMPQGNYWGEQCALKAVETLSAYDEIGVISYDWQGGQGGGGRGINNHVWNYELAPKADGSRVVASIKKMVPMDMPSFDDPLQLALHGAGPANAPCLKNSTAAQKHIIIISDGDPQQTNPKLINELIAAKVSISTVSVYPHGPVSNTMRRMAQQTGGRSYGPIDQNPGQLPQIFIKEATVVRRTLLQESKDPPIRVQLMPTASDIMKGIPDPPPIFGLVLSAKKSNPTIEMPLMASADPKKSDPLFAHWQAGLGKSAVFASGATRGWDSLWTSAPYARSYSKFWAQMVRGISRPPMSGDFAVNTERNGERATITVEATNKDAGFSSFLSITGKVMDPDGKQHDVRLLQTGPGAYTADFPTSQAGNYVVSLQYTSPDNKQGWLITGVAVNDSPETRQLKSNDLLIEEIAEKTGGRVLPAFDVENASLFDRKGVKPSISPLPVWDILIPILLGLILLDVAARRIAWDWVSTKKLAFAMANWVREFTLTRKVETRQTLDALKKVRDEVVETRFKPQPSQDAAPDRSAKFEAKTKVEGDITQIVGGATAKPVPAPPKKIEPKGAPASGGHTGSLLEAKRRAQQKIKEREQGDQ